MDGEKAGEMSFHNYTFLDELVDVLCREIAQGLRQLGAAKNDLKIGDCAHIGLRCTLFCQKSLEGVLGSLFEKLEKDSRLTLEIVKQHLVVLVDVRQIYLHEILSSLPLVNQRVTVNELCALAKVAEEFAEALSCS